MRLIGHENATVHGAAKAGLLSYARGLTYELKDRGVRVNGLSPGPTVTNAFAPLGLEHQATLHEALRRTVPLHRLGTPTELAKAAVCLASDEFEYTAGTVLRVDGGIGKPLAGRRQVPVGGNRRPGPVIHRSIRLRDAVSSRRLIACMKQSQVLG